MDIKLEIGGKTYTFTANRKAICALTNLQSKESTNEDMIDDVFYAMLKKEHNLSREEISELLDVAEKEYGVGQLVQFCTAVLEEVFQTAEEENKQYKKIEFLNRKNK